MQPTPIGRKNILFGWIFILLGIFFGIYLEMKLADPEWGIGTTRVLRKLLKDAHGHALCLAFLNVLYGLTIDATSLSTGMKNQGAWLAIIGAVVFPFSMVLTIINPPLFYGTYVAGFFLFVALWIIIVGLCRRPAAVTAPPPPQP
jgi:hypothetical protein